MRIDNVRVTNLADGTQRLSAIVHYDDHTEEEYWFTAPQELALSTSGNPWLAILLPLAAYTGQNLEIGAPVDPYLLQNAECLLKLWQAWYKDKVKPIQVTAPISPIDAQPTDVLSTFTAGVDAYFTVLRHPECTRYVNVLGLDMPLANRAAHERLMQRLSKAAAERGATMIPMATNLRETRWSQLPWETYSSGGALAGSFLVLERNFGKILIPSSFDYGSLIPWGTHPLSDPLYSTSRTQIIHEGMSHSRSEKIEFISNFESALKNLHVCFQGQDAHGQDDTNCCVCSKCYRTMIVLEILGKLGDCSLFDRNKFDLGRIEKLDTSSAAARAFFEDIRALAVRFGRADIVNRIDRSFRRSLFVARFDSLGHVPFLWRVPYHLRRRAFRGFAVLDRRAPNVAMSQVSESFRE